MPNWINLTMLIIFVKAFLSKILLSPLKVHEPFSILQELEDPGCPPHTGPAGTSDRETTSHQRDIPQCPQDTTGFGEHFLK